MQPSLPQPFWYASRSENRKADGLGVSSKADSTEILAEKPLDDAVYIMRIWQATFGAKTEYDDVPF